MADAWERIVATEWSGDGLYESNYLKANAPDGRGAFWLKHNVLVPEGGRGPSVAEFWCVLWEADWRPQVWKAVLPLDRIGLWDDRIAIESPLARLAPEEASGSLPGDEQISWNLAIRNELPPLRHFDHDWMYRAGFPRKKAVTASPRAVFDGAFTVGGRTVAVDGWIGHRGHNWGSEHAERYAYGNCNLWDDGADLTVDGFTVQVRVAGPVRTPWLTLVVGLQDGSRYGDGGLLAAVRSSGEVEWPRWFAWGGRRGSRRIRLEMELDPTHAAGLRYLHPDGRLSHCYNVKDARVDLRIGEARHTSQAGELEFLFPDPLPGIALHGEASLEELAQTASG